MRANGSAEGGSRPKPAQRVERSESLEAPEASLTITEVMASSRTGTLRQKNRRVNRVDVPVVTRDGADSKRDGVSMDRPPRSMQPAHEKPRFVARKMSALKPDQSPDGLHALPSTVPHEKAETFHDRA